MDAFFSPSPTSLLLVVACLFCATVAACSYVPVTKKGYWQIDMEDVKVSGESVTTVKSAILDSGTSLLVGPSEDVKAIASKVVGSFSSRSVFFFCLLFFSLLFLFFRFLVFMYCFFYCFPAFFAVVFSLPFLSLCRSLFFFYCIMPIGYSACLFYFLFRVFACPFLYCTYLFSLFFWAQIRWHGKNGVDNFSFSIRGRTNTLPRFPPSRGRVKITTMYARCKSRLRGHVGAPYFMSKRFALGL